ncbi:ABC transporter ATP-binding protein [Umezakia ovalisporum]|jgi:multiple sugar transport system ATP-binding protein|uniref:ABC transporter ATP-binding protein n=1 Tax=Umezakia ovalisporum FSS-43 TaxID=2740520 RepID=A0ABT6K0R3_9CYAN|nr:ABC transporter ATP-binding protein [Umezakia ovalisporum]MBI1241063.1 sn-glycerol-3-phosphate ABC transporter ATP-binding protein UgpC [Nostoc sp. RI_552]MDH6055837.1 ABC transporter ATP-binding protein [Umezakia ovalisporum FSS-43]MDH6070645.1 ABC transporter ATP-binding protein [Umezakia ovalisporum CobakiLakeA]MDH6075081.1 ABC transporter ATP-binding protein [Umezakia ovalisporum CS-1034]MDH6079680.1 ABC transporter ATP-binding protein [Umezakia ovalisporum FSS-45]
MARVYLEEIKRKFNNVTAIEDITFEIPDGEFWVLVGPSGCGKSTILRTIAGLESATSGNLFIGDRLVNNIPARQRDIAMVFQNYALYPHMTVAQNIAFGLKMRKVDPKIIQERVVNVARSLSLENLLDRKPKQLSGGQQQRVALGRAIAREPQVFLLDEPLSNLDAQLRDDTRAELKQLHQQLGITTIYVTHDQVEAMTLADQIVVLDRGRIQQIGDPQSIYALPANQMVATFLGNPPMNILPGVYKNDVFDVSGQSLPVPAVVREKVQLRQGQSFDLGIRPEHIYINEPGNGQAAEVVNSALLVVEVKVVEPLGRENLIRASLPGSMAFLNIQTASDIRPRPGYPLSLQLDLSQLFVFDTAGNRISPT